MIELKPELFAALDTPAGLPGALQQAIMLEHATIPTYLYALFSLGQGNNSAIHDLIFSVVVEEMLHMSLACNLLNALDGQPVLNQPGFIPQYPGPLPGGVDTGLVVPLAPFSLALVQHVFMAIEEPETPLEFPIRDLAGAPTLTIGAFYGRIGALIQQGGDALFTGDPTRQVTGSAIGFTDLIAVTNVDSALKAIKTIVEQGEGTSASPQDAEAELAHYYKFSEIRYGRTLIPNPTAPPTAPPDQRYVYGGDPVPFDPTTVLPVVTNPTAAQYPIGSPARNKCEEFNYTYTSLLNALHDTFNGQPTGLGAAVGMMPTLTSLAGELMAISLDDGSRAGPSFEYQPVNPGRALPVPARPAD